VLGPFLLPEFSLNALTCLCRRVGQYYGTLPRSLQQDALKALDVAGQPVFEITSTLKMTDDKFVSCTKLFNSPWTCEPGKDAVNELCSTQH
jgi:hypothetical protein